MDAGEHNSLYVPLRQSPLQITALAMLSRQTCTGPGSLVTLNRSSKGLDVECTPSIMLLAFSLLMHHS